ncbi:Putative peptidoglycan binding domain-containing protein [Microbulbifer thermotolerans]|uniref:L,D-transpeptidase family protein n=1 Tax=Microbulbifer thermotolerans TaxID=252514 RepID=UPI0008E5BFD0|nr:L,D-transpeptidase family protein [Microbulbifer thermotolerans]MCX2795285.1 L,D-transpeptidase family protein [Microbulbifer thermotolerans]MCX2835228.1 L,D-transpeptidase family protein [Microbulbifer thermotolerans]SFD02778.1 Putative peptidoglycan binding domain-containing protein [Microbulbifer thermotolerans]
MTQRQARFRPGHWLATLLILAATATPLLAYTPAQGAPALVPADVSAALRRTADRYRQLQQQWRPLSGEMPLAPGDRGERVTQLRHLLELYGDYKGTPGPLPEWVADRQRFDSALQRAVENYQMRHGLAVTGVAGPATLAALAVPPKERARRLELNASRWDKLSLPADGRYVLVNVPDYRLQLIDKGRVALSMKIVVGKTSSRTPELKSRITNVVFNPTWTVPRNILLTELLPKARNNPEAMHKRGYRVINYRGGDIAPISDASIARAAEGGATLRQLSGPDNALGKVKFVIPNNQAIFLHDTLAHSQFAMQERAFSHGCVRLEKPEELAYALLNSQGWDRTRIAQTATGNETLNVRVDKPPRLFITYLTAWVDNEGRPQFRRDIYHLDTP